GGGGPGAPGEERAGVPPGPPRRYGRRRRDAADGLDGDVPGLLDVLRGEATARVCVRLGAGTAGLPPLHQPRRARPPRPRLDGVAPNQAGRGERRFHGHEGRGSDPQRHRLTPRGQRSPALSITKNASARRPSASPASWAFIALQPRMRSSSLPSASVCWLTWLRNASSFRGRASVTSTHRLPDRAALIPPPTPPPPSHPSPTPPRLP